MNIKGFTIIELVMVIAILGIIGFALIRPNWGIFSSNITLKSQAEKIKNDIYNARQKAMSQEKLVKIVFNNDSGLYSWVVENSSTNSWVNMPNPPPLSDGIKIVTTTLANNDLIFDKSGRPYENSHSDPPSLSNDVPLGAVKSITIVDNTGTQKNIIIYPNTGYVETN
jgi:prepilin-type N-terminal cleavage/methylation domain-containing protein